MCIRDRAPSPPRAASSATGTRGQASDPDGITSVLIRPQRDGSWKLVIKGRNADLSTFDGTTDRSIQVRIEIGNDVAAANLTFRRRGTDLRYP